MLDDLDKKELIQIIQKLEKENNELKEKLYGKIEEKEVETEAKAISSEEKVKIFMEVFKGRTDLYAKRWTSNKTGKSGYSPVCKNEFSTYKCDKPRVKCNECPFRELTPLTEDIILKHLKGEITIGIYPLLPGDLCNFLAIDFDKKTFEKDVAAFWNICDELDIPIYVEKSRSGNGAHIWIFFEESIPARIARKMGNILLTKTMEKASLDLDSYDRLFPNQDTMPKGGFGNLIALPFQGESSKRGNTVFVDKYFEVEKNQINILNNIKRMKSDEIYAFIDKYKEDDYKEPDIEEILDDDEIPKKENDFIFIDLNMMSMQEYEELTDKIEEDEEERYYYLPSSYVFHDSELVEEYIDEIKNENIQEELEDAFYGKGKYRRFKETLRKFRIENDYYNFREEYLKNMAIEWCQKNNIEYEE